MDIKKELDFVKNELSSDEKILESAFKLERFYKKYKYPIWGIVAILILGFAGNSIFNAYGEHKLVKANEAYLTLLKNPNDKSALETLKSDNPKLYTLYLYSKGVDTLKVDSLKKISNVNDPLLKDIINYHISVLQNKPGSSHYYSDLSRVEKAYVALKEGKKDLARQELSLIPENSPVISIARLLRHYAI